ncbi:MAG: hypothetical protein CM15mP74_09090 [Halieaceae bacterium]|nr:MAG: hypothetical protein CM15mP74_09090 [Halieaceae bacterium]
MMESRDVVIVGAGASGLMLAARLAEGGQSVTVLEAGPARQLSDLSAHKSGPENSNGQNPPSRNPETTKLDMRSTQAVALADQRFTTTGCGCGCMKETLRCTAITVWAWTGR